MSRCSRAPPERINADLEKYNSSRRFPSGHPVRLPKQNVMTQIDDWSSTGLLEDDMYNHAVVSRQSNADQRAGWNIGSACWNRNA